MPSLCLWQLCPPRHNNWVQYKCVAFSYAQNLAHFVDNVYLLSDCIHDITEGVLPGIHLDHSDTHNHLIHHFDTFIRNTCCFESENEKGILMSPPQCTEYMQY